MIWALYLLLLAGAFTGVTQAVRVAWASHQAGRSRPGSHEDLP